MRPLDLVPVQWEPEVSVHLGSRLWHTPKKTRTRNPKWGDAGLLSMLIAVLLHLTHVHQRSG